MHDTMARLPRIVLPGLPHLLQQRGHNGQSIVHDAVDAQQWMAILREVAATQKVALHGWQLAPTWYAMLVTPPHALALARLAQDLGRRYVGAFNARHLRSGTLWDGRYHSAVVQPGAWERLALCWLEASAPDVPGLSTRAHHLGQADLAWLTDPKSYWSSGNTPFERQAAWKHLLDAGLSAQQRHQLESALRSGRPLGDADWRRQLQNETAVPLEPRPRGRPRKTRLLVP
jgi:putative transposase